MAEDLIGFEELASIRDPYALDRSLRRLFARADFPPAALLTIQDEGLIYVSSMERIDIDTARPLAGQDRWSTRKIECRAGWSIRAQWRCVFDHPDRRHWRIFVFGHSASGIIATGVTTGDSGATDPTRIIDMSREPSAPLLPNSGNSLPPAGPLQVMLYRLEKPPGDDPPIRRIDARLPIEEHLSLAHLLEPPP